MLGVSRQPFCGKCCGEHTKDGNARQKRAERRSTAQAVSMLTGFSIDELNELGGFGDECDE